MKEIVTVQLGGYANYIGAHFWNFQDELLGLATDTDADPVFRQSGLDMDVLYRAGETRQGIATYTPRLVAVDLRGSLGGVRSCGSLYDGPPLLPTKVSTWSGCVQTHRAEPSKKSEFLQRLEAEEAGETSETTDEALVQKLDDGVESWTDYLKLQLHPRSVYEIEGVWNKADPFDNFGCGKGLFTQSFRLEEFQERLRFFVEECDHIQGVQALIDDSGGFSGVASDILSDLEDEYGDISLMLFTVRPPDDVDSPSIVRSLHDAVSFASMCSYADVMVPLGLSKLSQTDLSRYLIVEDTKPFHTSAVYAAAVHSVTLPFRMGVYSSQAGACDMNTLLKNVSYANKKVAHLAAALPAPPIPVDKGVDMLSFTSLTAEVVAVSSANAVESIVFQGARLAGSKGPATISEVTNAFNYERWKQNTNILSHFACSPCPLPIPLPFPSIFSPCVGQYGDILEKVEGQGKGGLEVFNIPVATSIRADNGVLPYLTRRLNDLELLGVKRGARGSSVLEKWGFVGEDAGDLREVLSGVLSQYSNVVDMDSE